MTWSNGFGSGRGKIGAPIEKGKGSWQRIVVVNEWFFGEEKTKTREDKRMVKLDYFSKLPFLDIY